MLESEAYKTYLAYATGEKIPKPKYGKNKADSESSPKKKTATTAKGKRLKTSAKAAKPAKKKQPAKTSKAKGLTVLSEVAVTEAEQMNLATKRSLIKSSDEEDDDEVGLNDNDDDNDDDEDNDDDDDDADNQDDEDQEDDGQDDEDQDDVNEQTDSDNEGDDFVHPKLSTQDQEVRHNEEESDEESQGANVEEEELDEEETNDEDETNVQTTKVIEDTHVIITLVNPEGQQQSSSVSSGFVSNMLNPSPDTSIDSIFNLNTESTSLIDVPVTTIVEPPLLSTTTLPPPPTPLITHLLRDEAQAKNEDFLNKLDDNIKKIIKDQVKEQVKAQTSHAVAANLYELELKKILIDKMESNKSIHRSDEQKNLYKALVDAYESDKLILDTYRENVSFKRRRDDEDKDEEPSAGSNQGSKRRRARKEPESTSAPKEKISKTTGKSTNGPNLITSLLASLLNAEGARNTPAKRFGINRTSGV
ncbi:hypothetical protein Tco_0223977 [Tanacetum coccineum]